MKNIELVKGFVDQNYEDFQLWLEEVHKIEGTEAELILERLNEKLFITEVINDLHRNGFVRGGKAETMLHEFGAELRKLSRSSFPASRLKKVHASMCGATNW